MSNKIITVVVVLLAFGTGLYVLIFLPTSVEQAGQDFETGETAREISHIQVDARKQREEVQRHKAQEPAQTDLTEKKSSPAPGVNIDMVAQSITESSDNVSLDARIEAVDKLAKLATDGSDEAFRLLVKLAREKRYVQKFVVEALGRTKKAEAVSVLGDFISHETPGVAVRAARALGELGLPEGIKPLLRGLSQNRNRPDGYGEEIRREIVLSLSKLRATEAVGALGAELDAEEDISLKNLVAQALGEIGSADALPYLNRYIEYLKKHEPQEKIARFAWEEAVKTVRDAVGKIEEANK